MKFLRLTVLLALAASLVAACSKSSPVKADADSENSAAPSTTAQAPAARVTPAGPLPQVDGTRAFQYAKEATAFGPRWVGNAAHQKLEAYLRSHLKSDPLEEDSFTAQTPAGALPMRNFIAKFPGKKDGIIVMATHYDTLYKRADFVGANDGGSGTGLLLAMADVLRGKVRDGYSIWLVWLDGEEAIRQWTNDDSVYGSRHLAQKWQQDGTIKKVKAFLLADMIGDAGLDVQRDDNSTPWLEDLVYEAAKQYGYQSFFFQETTAVDDDHRPFREAGVPVADIIDFDYGYDNAFWHSKEDTIDKLSPKSLMIVGDVMLETARYVDQR